jgi:hypothetical protein
MDENRYKLSFTAAGLSISESFRIAEVYLSCKNWEETKKIVLKNNLLQSRTNARTIRTYREISQRLKLLSINQIELLVEGDIHEQKNMLWFTVCNRYKFIQEFAIEVIHEKFMLLDFELTELDYDVFFNRKVDWHEELFDISDSTKQKLKTVIFRMLREAELITKDNLIIQTILSERLIEVLAPKAPMSFQIFPLQLSDVQD